MTGQFLVRKLKKNYTDVSFANHALGQYHLRHFCTFGDTTKAVPSFMGCLNQGVTWPQVLCLSGPEGPMPVNDSMEFESGETLPGASFLNDLRVLAS